MLFQRRPSGFPCLWNAQFVCICTKIQPPTANSGLEEPGNATGGMLSSGHSWNSSLIAPTWILTPALDPLELNVALWGANPGNFLLPGTPDCAFEGSPAAGNQSLGCLSPSETSNTPKSRLFLHSKTRNLCCNTEYFVDSGQSCRDPIPPRFWGALGWAGEFPHLQASRSSGTAVHWSRCTCWAGSRIHPRRNSCRWLRAQQGWDYTREFPELL